jgi:hypothetical protein
MQLKVEDFHTHVENNDGYCTVCDDVTRTGGTEPDAREYPCPKCGQLTVMGVEQALVEGHIEPAD